jgi:Mg-chelatase subunit ChlD
MKSKDSQETGSTENRAQLILIGGLVIAVAVVAIALVVGGGLFSQSTVDDGGLSSFTSETDDQIQTARTVGQQDIEFVNDNSTLLQGAYPDEICGEIADKAAVQQIVSRQLGQGESVTNIEVVEDCTDNQLNGSSWLVGQKDPGYQLPSVNASNSGGRAPVDVVFAIDTTGSMGLSGSPPAYSEELTKPWQTPSSGVYPKDDLTSTYRSDTGVKIPDSWIEVRGTTDWSGSAGDMVEYDDDIAQAKTVVATDVCDGFNTFFGCIGTITDEWEIEYSDGTTEDVYETDLDNGEYRLEAPERMWFTQVGLKNALGDLDGTGPDRAGLLEYDTSTTEHVGIDGVDDPSHVLDIKEEADKFFPNDGTDIATAIQDSKQTVNDAYDSSRGATKNIVLMTDGIHNPFNKPGISLCDSGEAYDCSIAGNQDEYEDIYIHVIILGEGAANDVDAVSDMAEIANDPDPDLSNAGVSESDLPPRDDPRNEGTLIASDDPSDAEDIFEDIVEDIQATTEDSATGEVSEIQDIRMNVSDFQGNGTYRVEFNNGSDVIWQMEVDNKFISPDLSSNGYEVRFRSEVNSSLDETIEVSESKGNLSESGNYVWLDLTGKDDSKPRLDVGGLSTTETENQLGGTSPDAYITDAWQAVRNEVNDGGVNTVFNHTGPNGPSNPPFRRGKVKGTFALEFEPKNGNFTKIKQITGGNFTDDCDTANETNLPSRCGLNDPGNDREAVSTTRVNELDLRVTVKGPEGVSERVITVSPQEELDIFEE